MNKIPCFLIFTFFFIESCLFQNKTEVTGFLHPQNFENLIQQFKDPPIDYSTTPFWVWNDLVTEKKIESQLKMFKDNGIHQVIIHPRPGLITEYLSREWFELCAFAVQKGRELNMKIWLYDENSFPSGFGGGHVPASLPSNADLVVGLKMHKLNKLNRTAVNGYIIILKKIGNSFANISKGIQNYLNEPGEFYAFSKWYYPQDQGLYGGFSYVDLLAYGITERFIQITMRGYEEYLGKEFGKTVPGIFTDEPHIHTSEDPSVIKYTPVLFNRFEEEFGYPLENYLPCLFEEIGDWKNVRHDYYALLLDMFIERWAKPWNIYTDSNKLRWTGHYWEHMWPNPEYVADNMAIYAWHHIPGIDMLFNNEKKRPDQFGNTRAVKELSSAANQLGKERTLSETYGASGWELTFEDMKRLGDWEYALGVNLMNQHLSYMTLKGARKRDFPLSFSYHTPWWKQYKMLNEYFHRLSYALSSGQQINKILIIEPTSTAWMYFSPNQAIDDPGVTGKMTLFENSFRSFLDDLEKYQVEYDLGSEKILADFGSVENDQLIIGMRKYTLVILPPMFENLEKTTFNLLVKYLENEGKVISYNEIPSYIDGNISRQVRETFSKLNKNWFNRDSLKKDDIIEHMQFPDFLPVDPENWNGRVFHHRRQLKDGVLLFFSNFDTLQTAEITINISGKSILEFDIFTGDVYQFPVNQLEKDLILNFKLNPAGSKLFFVSDNKLSYPAIEKIDSQKLVPILTSETRIRRNGPNALTLDYCDVEFNDKKLNDIYFYNAADSIFKEYLGEIYGFNYNPWSVAVQYRTNILDKNKNLENSDGFIAHFPFIVENNFIPDDIKVIIESPELFNVMINDKTISPIDDTWWLDQDFGVYDISENVKAGKNTVSLQIQPMNVLAELEPIYLTGNFSVIEKANGWEISNPENLSFGSWKDLKLPFYSGSVSYIKSFNLNNQSLKNLIIRLPDWKGIAAEVILNKKSAGIIGWPPYQLDISEGIQDGDNEIEIKIYGSLKNLLGPHHNHQDKGFVTPWSFFYAPKHKPPGNTYDLYDYGLMKDFTVEGY